MGLCMTIVEVPFKEYDQHAALFTRLGITKKEASKLWTFFLRIDKDNSGQISIMEFLEFFGLDRTKFAKRAFGLFDVDGSGEIDYGEFVISLWNYLTYDKHALSKFAVRRGCQTSLTLPQFDLYDLDSSGSIDLSEMQCIVKEVYGDKYRSNVYAQRIMDKILNHQGGLDTDDVSIDAFDMFISYHPALLFPAFKMQGELQKQVMGERYWMRAADLRRKMDGNTKGEPFSWKKLTETAFKTLAEGNASKKKDKNNRFSRSKRVHPDSTNKTADSHQDGKRTRQDASRGNAPVSRAGSMRHFPGGGGGATSGGKHRGSRALRRAASDNDLTQPANGKFCAETFDFPRETKPSSVPMLNLAKVISMRDQKEASKSKPM